MYRVVAGLDTDWRESGYKHAVIHPQPGGGLTYARASLDSPYGEIRSAWELTEDAFTLQVTVPANARATVRVPADGLAQVTESGQALDRAEGVISAQVEGKEVVVQVRSGQYRFTSTGLNLAKAMSKVRHMAGRLDIYCSVRELLESQAAKAVLFDRLGEDIFQSPQMRWAMDQPLEALARFAPDVLTPERLQALQQELVAL
jgi:hypothetical protein